MSGAAIGYGALTSLINSANDTLWSIPQGFIGNWISNKRFDYQFGKQLEAQYGLLDYNSPKNQMARLAEAGLNPNLVYGQGAGPTPNMSAPSQSQSGDANYTTSDVAGAALSMAHMKQAEAARHDLEASARLKNVQAANMETYNEYYPYLLQLQVEQAEQNLEKVASEISVNKQSVQYSIAQQKLAEAQTLFMNSEIGLQEYRKQQMVAQTNLFISEKKLNEARKDLTRTQDYNLDIQNRLDALEVRYKELFYGDDGKMKKMSDAEYNAKKEQFLFEAAKAGAQIGIQGNKGVQWAEWAFSQFGKIAGGAASGVGAAAIKM